MASSGKIRLKLLATIFLSLAVLSLQSCASAEVGDYATFPLEITISEGNPDQRFRQEILGFVQAPTIEELRAECVARGGDAVINIERIHVTTMKDNEIIEPAYGIWGKRRSSSVSEGYRGLAIRYVTRRGR
ncbi:MAG: hypothetical protein NUW37_05295 [Planctomycetes bacterium]|nr:hypothetical protein [Planctomycetota bacterium]